MAKELQETAVQVTKEWGNWGQRTTGCTHRWQQTPFQGLRP